MRSRGRHGRRRQHNDRDERDLPPGAILKSKPQLVGIHDRVRSDVGGTHAQHQKAPVSVNQNEGKRVATATNPNLEDAADLLRMCVQCGIPKTFTTGKGMVCPVCNDRPPADPNKESEKKKGSTIKDREKNKRMKGQSLHASRKNRDATTSAVRLNYVGYTLYKPANTAEIILTCFQLYHQTVPR